MNRLETVSVYLFIMNEIETLFNALVLFWCYTKIIFIKFKKWRLKKSKLDTVPEFQNNFSVQDSRCFPQQQNSDLIIIFNFLSLYVLQN